MTSVGEKQHYTLALIQRLTEHIPDDMLVGLLYDIGCQLERSWRKFKFFDNSQCVFYFILFYSPLIL
ncbi:hypothetical protein HYDPIDRAFT_95563 [Hydnomerulius pinastri MD-312]|uniref:Uncharacterized protein n=1 Tax=Hydnomerulius pinastri MD-312 TaxID=994086 RepID=A0A0C9WCU7_9AGAM|nr:hypothetical protein HYDPIDRAFT_95563 [Hydnomerulius pinastri MD-312]